MVKYFKGQIVDADTDRGVLSVITSQVDPTSNTTTDGDGNFDFAIDDSVPAFFGWFEIAASGYGDAVTQIYGLDGSFFIYKTDASAVTKAKAIIKNSFLGYAITIIAILVILFIAKKYLPQ